MDSIRKKMQAIKVCEDFSSAIVQLYFIEWDRRVHQKGNESWGKK